MRNVNACVSNPNEFITCAGDEYHITYDPIINPDGTITLVESGKDDIQEMINSYREQTDMAYILSRMAAGDVSIYRDGAMYGDFTDMPKTYAESLQMVIDAERKFNQLPLDVRNKFDNDYKQWFAQAGSESWLARMSDVILKDDVKEEVKEEVNSSNES